jgi:hypothetical protein
VAFAWRFFNYFVSNHEVRLLCVRVAFGPYIGRERRGEDQFKVAFVDWVLHLDQLFRQQI